ncbi:putative 2-dehydropantoate 2-reductase [Pseudomonas quasicaspiana]|uniref:putative 2-dehydropantoate 2-reductase n=1 Tax=Pseudomonas quasicaspiana TaxID=2829821 RepID=UPI001E573676|nr:putative 2-dehydropantoate 2-reductase [Pseudomonas quasicaspiana]MCD5975457.1 putative 2-dehydropantoate 2-reductase [Pseudomonas quasicaspiana]
MNGELKQPRIGIIGTGAIGGFYGVMLARAGFDVHFLLRSEFDAVARDGLCVKSAVHGELVLNPVQAYSCAADMPPCDWLLIGAKSTSNAALTPAILQAAAPGARVLVLQNGLAVEDSLRAGLPDSLNLLGGLCFICVHRSGPGKVVHQALGGVNLGYHSGPAADAAARQAIVEQGAGLFHAAGLDSQAMVNLQQARWQKLVWNIPYNGLSALLQAGTEALMTDSHTRALILTLMNEVVRGAEACGHVLPEGYAHHLFAMTEKMPDYQPSMYLDYKEQRPLELDAIYIQPLSAATQAGCDMPQVRMLYQALAFLDAHNNRIT